MTLRERIFELMPWRIRLWFIKRRQSKALRDYVKNSALDDYRSQKK